MQRVEHGSKGSIQDDERRTSLVLTEICNQLSIDDLEEPYQ